jgi:hypothetical protein
MGRGGGLFGSERRIKRLLASDRNYFQSALTAYKGMKVDVSMLQDYCS